MVANDIDFILYKRIYISVLRTSVCTLNRSLISDRELAPASDRAVVWAVGRYESPCLFPLRFFLTCDRARGHVCPVPAARALAADSARGAARPGAAPASLSSLF